jgi:hypothetical protein
LKQGETALAEAEPIAFVLQSEPGLLESLPVSDAGSPAGARRGLAVIAHMQGRQSDGMRHLEFALLIGTGEPLSFQ